MRVKVLDPELYAVELESNFAPKYLRDAGVDLRSRIDTRIHSGTTEKVPLGIAVDIPWGYVGWLTGRSSTHLELGLFAHEGKIDRGYTGEIHAFLTSQGSPVEVKRGDRVCQLIVVKIEVPSWQVVPELDDSDRGELGLGSTGIT